VEFVGCTTLCDGTPPGVQGYYSISSSGKFSSIIPYSHRHCTTRLSLVSPPQEIFDKIERQITLLQGWLKGLVATLFQRKHKKAGYDEPSALIYMMTVWRRSCM
jgi:hypothetical protein